MYKYETHLHTSPVSKCARSSVREMLTHYKAMSYAGVFITNHFIDGNINIDKTLPYEEKVNFYFTDYEEGVAIGNELGLKVFFGVELSYKGTDFLIYGLDKAWFLAHPEIEEMKKSEELALMMREGALIIHAHPFREARYIDHIRLFPRLVHGVEICNAERTDFENGMAKQYAAAYELIPSAGSDIHFVKQERYAGVAFDTPIANERDFIDRMKKGEQSLFFEKPEEA